MTVASAIMAHTSLGPMMASEVALGALVFLLMIPGGVCIAIGGIRFGRVVLEQSFGIRTTQHAPDTQAQEAARRSGLRLRGVGFALVIGVLVISTLLQALI
jgi:hypothetical protein